MNLQETYMMRCLELARGGIGNVAPNPMVGCVIVHNDKIIAEGFHKQYGGAHAEVEAINTIENKQVLKEATLYVNLEPCSHHGKTPPCADLIIKYKIPHVIIGTLDTNSKVAGQGIKKLIEAGVDVNCGVLEEECRSLNKRFFTFHEEKRPYVILKWAQSIDGYIDINRKIGDGKAPIKISNAEASNLVHQWRSEEQAIMVGTNTALLDNPQLTVRNVKGKNPLRVVIDKEGKIPSTHYLVSDNEPTLLFTYSTDKTDKNKEFVSLRNADNIIEEILTTLFERGIQSVIIEGGSKLLNSFIEKDLWDEARVIIGQQKIENGIKAPLLKQQPISEENLNGDTILYYTNQ